MNILLLKFNLLRTIRKHTFRFFIAILLIICLLTFIQSRSISIDSAWTHEERKIWDKDSFTISEFEPNKDFVVMDFDQWKKLAMLMNKKIFIDISRLKKAGEISYFFSNKNIYFISHKRIALSWDRDILYEIVNREFDTIDSIEMAIKERENIIALKDSLVIFLIGIAYWIIMLSCVLIYKALYRGSKFFRKDISSRKIKNP